MGKSSFFVVAVGRRAGDDFVSSSIIDSEQVILSGTSSVYVDSVIILNPSNWKMD